MLGCSWTRKEHCEVCSFTMGDGGYCCCPTLRRLCSSLQLQTEQQGNFTFTSISWIGEVILNFWCARFEHASQDVSFMSILISTIQAFWLAKKIFTCSWKVQFVLSFVWSLLNHKTWDVPWSADLDWIILVQFRMSQLRDVWMSLFLFLRYCTFYVHYLLNYYLVS